MLAESEAMCLLLVAYIYVLRRIWPCIWHLASVSSQREARRSCAKCERRARSGCPLVVGGVRRRRCHPPAGLDTIGGAQRRARNCNCKAAPCACAKRNRPGAAVPRTNPGPVRKTGAAIWPAGIALPDPPTGHGHDRMHRPARAARGARGQGTCRWKIRCSRVLIVGHRGLRRGTRACFGAHEPAMGRLMYIIVQA